MSSLAVLFIAELLRATAALSVAVLVVELSLRSARVQSARTHRAAWLLALLAGWTFTGPTVAIPWHETAPAVEPAADVATAPAIALASDPLGTEPPTFELAPSTEPLAPALELTAPTEITEAPLAAPPLDFAIAPPAAAESMPLAADVAIEPQPLNWQLWLAGIWLAGMAAAVAVWLIGYVRFVRQLPVFHVEEPAWETEWRALLATHGVRRPIALRVTDELGPMLCRLPSGYALLVPLELWQELGRDQRLAILRHELAHYQRGDLWWSLAARLLALPHWFNPAAWWAARRFDDAAEWACDAAAAGDDQSTVYAQALLQLGEASLTTRYGTAARTGSLAGRVRRILQPTPEDSAMKTRLLDVAAVCLAVLMLVRVELVAREPEGAAAPRASEQPTLTLSVAQPVGPQVPSDAKPASAAAQAAPTAPQFEVKSDAKITVDVVPGRTPGEPLTVTVEHLKPSPEAQRSLDAAKEAYEAIVEAYRAGTATLESVCNWSQRWLGVAVATARTPQQKVAAAQAHLGRMKTLQEQVHAFRDAGTRGGDLALVRAIDFFVAEAERQLAGYKAEVAAQAALPNSALSGSSDIVLEERVEQLPDGSEVRKRVARAVPKRPLAAPATAPSPAPSVHGYAQPREAQPLPQAAPRASQAVPMLQPHPTLAPPATYTVSSDHNSAELRYDGKSFAEWRRILATDLSADSRREAINALAAFGNEGRGKEAAKLILDLMRHYSIASITPSAEFQMKIDDSPEGRMMQAALRALRGIPREDVQPLLVTALESGNQNQRLVALQVLDDPELVLKLCLPLLKSADSSVRTLAVSGIGRSAAKSATAQAAIREALADPDQQVAKAALKVMYPPSGVSVSGNIQYLAPSAAWADDLVGLLTNADEFFRIQAANALRQLGPAAIPALEKGAQSTNEALAKRSAELLKEIQSAQEKDRSASETPAAAKLNIDTTKTATLVSKRARPQPLVGGKTYSDWDGQLDIELDYARRREAVMALAIFGQHGQAPQVARRLMELMREYSPTQVDEGEESALKATISGSFTRLPREATQPVILETLKTGNQNQRIFALNVLAQVMPREDSIAVYAQAGRDADPLVAVTAMQALLVLADQFPAAHKLLAAALTDSDAKVARAALGALIPQSRPDYGRVVTLQPSDQWNDELVELLTHPDEQFRKYAKDEISRRATAITYTAQGPVTFGSTAVRTALEKAAKSSDEALAKQAAEILTQLPKAQPAATYQVPAAPPGQE